MNNRYVRVVVPLVIVALATAFIYFTIFSKSTGGGAGTGPTGAGQGSTAQTPAPASGDEAGTTAGPAEEGDREKPAEAEGEAASGEELDYATWKYVEQPGSTLDGLGDIDSAAGGTSMRIEFTPVNGGIRLVTLRDYYESRDKKPEQRTTFFANAPEGRAAMGINILELPGGVRLGVPADPATKRLVPVWKQITPGEFVAEIVDGTGKPALTIRRKYTLGAIEGQIAVDQQIVNHTGHNVPVVVQTWGPGDLPLDPVRRMGDYRRVRFGYVDPRNPNVVLSERFYDTQGMVVSNAWNADSKAMDAGQAEMDRGLLTLWPNETSKEQNLGLAWVAQTDRYFGFAVYPNVADVATITSRELAQVKQVEFLLESNGEQRLGQIPKDQYLNRYLSVKLVSPTLTIPANGALDTSLDAYCGPLHKETILKDPVRGAFSLDKLPIYQMPGSCWCTVLCTFQSLAIGLLTFLRLIEGDLLRIGGVGIGVHDWGLAIIILVICVRALLHPLTKKGQVTTMRFSKKMQALQPELAKLKEKYKDDAKKMQQEQIRLYREHNVNPAGCMGMLPTFIQMPIWIALYAMLFFAIELRQAPAFYGMFQMFGNWGFLADLSQPDQFISLGKGFTIPYFGWQVASINLLPILMGLVFYIQQKYMMPPSTNLTPEQETQQRIMKVMSVVLFPLMLYTSPSGLTLYIMTSTLIGIFESKYIRAHVTALELEEEAKKKGVKVADARVTKR